MSEKIMYSWRQAIQEAQLASTTKLVLLNLSLHMSDVGDTCFPSIEKQARDTGLSKRCVCEHLELAAGKGFITKKKHGYAGQKWARNEYFATFPKGGYSNDILAEKGGYPGSKGGYSDDIKAVTDGHSNYPVELSKELTSKKYTKKKSKKITLQEWEQVNNRLTFENIRSWSEDQELDEQRVSVAIEDFRARMEAGGNVYVDYAAAFQVWLRSGWLMNKLPFEYFRSETAKPPKVPSTAKIPWSRELRSPTDL